MQLTVQPVFHLKNNVAPSDNNRTLHSLVSSGCCVKHYCLGKTRLFAPFQNADASYDFSSNDPYPYPRYTDDWFNR